MLGAIMFIACSALFVSLLSFDPLAISIPDRDDENDGFDPSCPTT